MHAFNLKTMEQLLETISYREQTEKRLRNAICEIVKLVFSLLPKSELKKWKYNQQVCSFVTPGNLYWEVCKSKNYFRLTVARLIVEKQLILDNTDIITDTLKEIHQLYCGLPDFLDNMANTFPCIQSSIAEMLESPLEELDNL